MSVATYPRSQCPVRIDFPRTADLLPWLGDSGTRTGQVAATIDHTEIASQNSNTSSVESQSKATVRERRRDDDSI